MSARLTPTDSHLGIFLYIAAHRDMLLLSALGADASSPLQPRDSGVDSVPRKTRHGASFESRVFVIGPNKAGTTSLDEHFTAMGLKSCHDTCPDKHGDPRARWDRTSHEKNASSPLWSVYNAFSDHGDHADYKWLDTAFPGSRFVLNTRALQPWILSSYDHVRVHREMYNCTSQGDASSCKGDGSSVRRRATSLLSQADGDVASNPSEWLDNSDRWITERVADAAAHQEEVMKYFDHNEQRRQRFIVVDVEGWKPQEVMLPLRWVTRPDLHDLPTPKLLVKPGQIVRDVLNKAQDSPLLHPAPDTPSAVHANPRAHPKESEEIVNRALRKFVSCPESMWQDVLYSDCAAYIEDVKVQNTVATYNKSPRA